ncbi:hypothetical protein [Verrucomicrobium sp. BvORR034]|uniref:hypothetical protein n=1 Tax=Verrucomicrobium sp. BvORR034 TaxID=1396418 RepID=UPI000679885A|nr:hypothetical protein [Verrucomicrobium sp. BvORR034]
MNALIVYEIEPFDDDDHATTRQAILDAVPNSAASIEGYSGAPVMLPGAMILVSPAPDCDVSKLLRLATRSVKDAGAKLTKICVVFFNPRTVICSLLIEKWGLLEGRQVSLSPPTITVHAPVERNKVQIICHPPFIGLPSSLP